MRFKVGQVVFFNWNNPFTKIIHFYNRVKFGKKGFAHCGIITKVNKNSIQIHEAIGKGFIKSNYTKKFIYSKMEEEVITLKETQRQYKLKNVEKNANKYLGAGYGYFDIFLIFINFITGFKFGGSKSKLICSEAVAKILYDASSEEINFSSEYGIPYDLITPMHIYSSIFLR